MIRLTEFKGVSIIINTKTIDYISTIDLGSKIYRIDGSFITVKESLEQIEDMILRDQFAMSALNGYLSNPQTDDLSAEEKVSDAYFIADEMLNQRKGK